MCHVDEGSTRRDSLTAGTVLLVFLIVLLIGAIPSWGYSRSWGYLPRRRPGTGADHRVRFTVAGLDAM
ncbi:MAG: DUF3309 family protein [Burkholderiaceae bacterium]